MATPAPAPPSKPEAVQRLAQAQHNYRLYQELKLGGRYPDWTVTVLFYAAMHLAEAYLAEREPGVFHRIKGHQDRLTAIGLKLPLVYGAYRHLHNQSTVARYHPDQPKPTPAEIEHSETEFIRIADELRHRGISVTL